MHSAFAYPNSEYAIPQPVDLSRKEERERLSHAALKGFFKLAAAWKLRDDDARELLGGLSSSAFYEWKKHPDRVLEVDRITRISYLLGIYKSLQILLPDPRAADEWVRKPNSAAPFGGRSALERMLSGHVADLYVVRQYLDAERG